MARKIKIGFLVPDDRDEFRDYSNPKPRFGPAPTALLEGLEQIDDCEIHVISCLHRPLPSPSKIGRNIWYHSLVVPKWSWRLTGYAGCVLAIRRKLRQLKPDLVHGQGTERYCALAAALSGLPNVITIHGNMRSIARFFRAKIGSFHWCAAALESFALRRTRGVFCNSAYTEGLVKPIARRTWRVPNALRVDFLQRPQRERQNSAPVLINIGTIAAHKAQKEILEVGRRLFNAGYQFELQFIGGMAPGDSYATEFMSLLKAAERDDFARHVTVNSIRDLLDRFDGADALIHFPREEAFGLVVAEALARNLKFFGCRTGGIPDIIEGIESADLFDVEDWDGLYAGLASWLASNQRVAIATADRMKERYHPSVIARRHIEIYHDVLANK